MKVLVYYQSEISNGSQNWRAGEVIGLLAESGYEIRFSTDDCYRNRLALLLKDIREYDFVLFVLDPFCIPRSKYTQLHILGPLSLSQYNLDVGILGLLAHRSASAVLASDSSVPRTLECPNLKFDESEDCEYRAVDSKWIVKAINDEGAKGVRLSEDFDRYCRDLNRATKSISSRVARLYARLRNAVDDLKSAVRLRSMRAAVDNPSGLAAKRFTTASGLWITGLLDHLDGLDPEWRDRETTSARAKRVSNWFRGLDQDSLFGNYQLESDVEWFTESFPEDAISLINASGTPALHGQFAEQDARQLVLRRARFRSSVASSGEISVSLLQCFDLHTCNLIENHSLDHKTLKRVLLEHYGHQWYLTTRAASHIQRLLSSWPKEPPTIYDDEYAGRFIWGSPDDTANWRGAGARCQKVWSERRQTGTAVE